MRSMPTQSTRMTERAGVGVCVTVFLAAWLSGSMAAAADQPKNGQESKPAAESSTSQSLLDDALLEDLDNELLDGLGDLKTRPADGEVNPKAASPEKQTLEPIDGEDIGDSGADDDPLGYISQEMRLAEELIPQRGKRNHAESVQQRILEDLSKLIEQAQKQRAQQQSSNSQQQQQQTAKRQPVKQPKSSTGRSQGQQNKPAADSTDRLGKAERARPDPELFQGLLKDTWGNLPEREREQMMQMSPERFLPQYELMIERYYQRLSEERLK
jgi:hypothetical protein